jgi:hypothetical protein
MRDNHSRTQDLVAFIATLLTGTVLVCLGVAPESLATIAIALSGLYAAWRGGRGPGAKT